MHVLTQPDDQGKAIPATPPRKGEPGRLPPGIHLIVEFWMKCANDWIFNLSSVLAYNLLASMIPILLALMALASLWLSAVTPSDVPALQRSIINVLPAGIGQAFVGAAALRLRESVNLILILSLATSLVLGSRLFIAMENCFGVVFRLRGRNVVRQNVMAIFMLMVYVLLAPLLFLGSIAPAAIIATLDPNAHSGFRGLLIQVSGIAAAMVVAIVLFGLIYLVVPNRPMRLREIWKGTLVAALLLLLYEVLFPVYVSLLLRPSNYGSVVGLLLVIMIFFYYLAFILLLGAEVNSWNEGQRRALGDIAAMVHEVQAHRSVEAIAGPTAGLPSVDLQHHKGAAAEATPELLEHHIREDHRDDFQPPRWWHPAGVSDEAPPPVHAPAALRRTRVVSVRRWHRLPRPDEGRPAT